MGGEVGEGAAPGFLEQLGEFAGDGAITGAEHGGQVCEGFGKARAAFIKDQRRANISQFAYGLPPRLRL